MKSAMALDTAKRAQPFAPPMMTDIFPPGYELLPGTSQIYELQLAREESRLLSEEEIIERGAYFSKIGETRTNHFKMCSTVAVQVDKDASARRRSFFQANQFKTGYATHGLFPYRGKFHPQMVKAIINVIGLRPGDTLLDPMSGSGTACVEAAVMGIDAIGIDASPFCCLMGKAKYTGANLRKGALLKFLDEADSLLDHFDQIEEDDQRALFRGNCNRRARGLQLDPDVEALLKLCYLDAVGYARRRVRKTVRDLFAVVLARYVAAIETFAEVRNVLGIKPANATFHEGDACNLKALKIKDQSVDGIVTSPPYSFAIDYVENDASQLHYMGVDIEDLRSRMIGLKGDELKERFDRYLVDMDKIMGEAHRVLRDDRYCVVVLGTNSNQLKRALGNTSENDFPLDIHLSGIARKHNFELVGDLIHPIEGIGNVMRDEHILFYQKVT